jgi:hypothetical protein
MGGKLLKCAYGENVHARIEQRKNDILTTGESVSNFNMIKGVLKS